MSNPESLAKRTRAPAVLSRARALIASLLVLALIPVLSRAAAESEPVTPDLTELPLEALMNIEIPTVYGASRYEQKATAAPSSVTVIGAEQIKRFGYRTLADVLQSVQGLHVSYDRNYAFLGSRGVNLGDFNSRILLLLDGHRLNNNLTDGAFIETAFALDVDLIDHVEIIRGPGSVLYGNNAFFGVINVVSRKGANMDGVEMSGEYGSFDTFEGRLSFGKQFTNGVELLLSGTLYDSEGPQRLYYPEFDTPDQNNGVARGLDEDHFGSFFGSLGYRDLTFQGAFISRDKGNPTAQYLTLFNDSRLETQDERGYMSLKYAHSFPDVVDVTARAYYDMATFGVNYPVTGALFREEQEGEWWGLEVQLDKQFFDRHRLTLGAEYRDDFRQHRRIFDVDSGTVFATADHDRQSHGVYFQGDIAVRTNLHVNGGVRYDQYGDFDPSFNPRVALIWNPTDTSAVKAIYGTAFRAPNFLELSDPLFQEIRPEEITSYELVYEQAIGRYMRSSAALFYNEMDDLIVFQNGSFTNFDAEARGLELALDGVWPHEILSRLSYTLQETRNRTIDDDLADSPNHLIKANLSVPVWKRKVYAGLEFQYTSGRHTTFTSTMGETIRGADAGGYGILNFTLFSRNLVKDLELSASVYNLLDRSYGDPASRFHRQDIIERDGRTFRIKVLYRF